QVVPAEAVHQQQHDALPAARERAEHVRRQAAPSRALIPREQVLQGRRQAREAVRVVQWPAEGAGRTANGGVGGGVGGVVDHGLLGGAGWGGRCVGASSVSRCRCLAPHSHSRPPASTVKATIWKARTKRLACPMIAPMTNGEMASPSRWM